MAETALVDARRPAAATPTASTKKCSASELAGFCLVPLLDAGCNHVLHCRAWPPQHGWQQRHRSAPACPYCLRGGGLGRFSSVLAVNRSEVRCTSPRFEPTSHASERTCRQRACGYHRDARCLAHRSARTLAGPAGQIRPNAWVLAPLRCSECRRRDEWLHGDPSALGCVRGRSSSLLSTLSASSARGGVGDVLWRAYTCRCSRASAC